MATPTVLALTGEKAQVEDEDKEERVAEVVVEQGRSFCLSGSKQSADFNLMVLVVG